MSLQIGAGVTRVSAETVYDPVRGLETHERWRGNSIDCALLATVYKNSGFRVSVERTDGVSEVNVFIQFSTEGGSAEVPADRWDLDKDYFQAPIWNNSKFHGLIATAAAQAGLSFATLLAEMRRVLENAQNGRQLILATPTDPDVLELYADKTQGPLPPETLVVKSPVYRQLFIDAYNLILRGGDFEAERCVVRRLRTFSINFAPRMILEAVPRVYSPSAFFRTFQVPEVIQRQLPETPAFTPDAAAWAWKLRRDVSVINWFGKVEETREWVFAPWSLLEYDYIEA